MFQFIIKNGMIFAHFEMPPVPCDLRRRSERNIMQEKKQDKYEFISEKIKEKPINKRKILFFSVFMIGMAVMFGIVASFVFTVCQPKMEEMLHPREDASIFIPKDEPQAETEEKSTETEETETEQPPEIIYEELTLADFQQLQSQMYAVGKEANKSIVTVTGVKSNTDWFNNAYESKGQGSGIIIADSGEELLILTEKKVIADVQSVYVTFVNDVSVEAAIKKYDGNTGITVLSVLAEEIDAETKNAISVAVLGNSLGVTQGTLALAVGSPLGTNYSILTGNITSSSNTISTVDANYSIFTTDIVGSKSGSGVLINLKGEVIGFVTQGYSSDGEQNTLTAISISELKPVIEMLSNDKDIPYIGLEIKTVTNTIAKENDIPKGVYIKDVKMDSPAMAAGLQRGDVITEIDGEAVVSADSYETKLLSLIPGNMVAVTVQRQVNDGYTEIECQVNVSVLP